MSKCSFHLEDGVEGLKVAMEVVPPFDPHSNAHGTLALIDRFVKRLWTDPVFMKETLAAEEAATLADVKPKVTLVLAAPEGVQ